MFIFYHIFSTSPREQQKIALKLRQFLGGLSMAGSYKPSLGYCLDLRKIITF